MHRRIKTLADLKELLEGWVADEAKLFEKQCAAREEGKLAHFMRWNAASFHIAVVRSSMAKELLEFIDAKPIGEEEPPVEPVSDEEKLSRLSEEATRRIMDLDLRLTDRNGSTSHNTADDAERAAWLSLFQMFNSGY